ncbi:hypothetical protein HY212_05900 [Candidatus Pacearchaeota archaeon]|nr:hypothetical protein [Candidatus Pacearchaeota archaeon]
MTKKTTAEERREYIERQRADNAKYGHGTSGRILVDTSFIDREGNIVRPNKEEYQAAIRKRDKYNSKRS